MSDASLWIMLADKSWMRMSEIVRVVVQIIDSNGWCITAEMRASAAPNWPRTRILKRGFATEADAYHFMNEFVRKAGECWQWEEDV